MAEDYRGRGLPSFNFDAPQYQTQPPLRPDDDRSRAPITLPSIHDFTHSVNARSNPLPLEPRSRSSYSVSPTDPSGYPPHSQPYLPSVQSMIVGDHRGGDRRAPLPPPPLPTDSRQQIPYRPAEPNGYYVPPPPPPPGPGPQREHASYSHQDYQYQPYPPRSAAGPPSMYDYRGMPNGAQQQPPSAPRQRTSIACRYCRKRKIRCSGYANTPDGKCTNCKKTGNECVFQPVSSSSSTAFVPISAIPGGVAPGTPLYGAFGQPLQPPGSSPNTLLQNSDPHQQQRQTPPSLPLPSPTGSFFDERAESTGRRRTRGPDDDHHAPRLPPPHPYQQDEDPRRRSPASSTQSSTPPTLYHHQYAPRTQSNTPPMGYPPMITENGIPRRDSPVAHAPASSLASSSNVGSIMSLGNLMDHSPPSEARENIDRVMLGRLGKRN